MKTTSLFIAILFFGEIISATGIKQPVSSQFGFIENKGQIIDQNSKPNPACLFLYNGSGLHVQLKQNSFSYEVWKNTERRAKSERRAACLRYGYGRQGAESEMKDSVSLGIHRIDVSFLNANKNPVIVASDIASDYLNYYTTGTTETGVTHVRHFKKVLYQNIYPYIDVEFLLNNQEKDGAPIAIGVKYNFIIHPGGNPKDILIKFDGATNASLNTEGNILIETAYGNIEESIPESYQMDNNNSKLKIASSYYIFQASPFTFGINPGNYDASKTLVIDPWATYYGGSGEDRSYGIAADGNGNIVITGSTSSTSGIATSGAFQTSNGGGNYDAFIVKFNSSGARLWATYYGGSGDDYGYGIAVDSIGNMVVTGRTGSSSGIATSGVYQTSNGGSNDAFIAKFNASGVRGWATYYGGSGNDQGNRIAVDSIGNIVITGYTTSTSGIATSGAHQTSNGGSNDAFIAKFNASGVRQWATYYGGSLDDGGEEIVVDGSGNIVITGGATSTSNIATSGAYQTSFGGYYDAFIAKFNDSGARLWATYFGGSDGDEAYGIAADGNGNIVITGRTHSTSGIATSGAYQTSYNGNGDAFIVKFDSLGALQWATYYGGSGGEESYGIAVDGSGNIVITGLSTSTSGIATSGAYQTSYGGWTDAFIAKFNSSGARQWATYYGGSLSDVGLGIAVNGIGNMVVTGRTGSSSGIATSGAYQTSFGGGISDAFVASFTPNGGLPVKLISFDAKLLSGKEVLLSWQTASETNNDFFEVERMVDGSRLTVDGWEKIGKVKGNGSTNSVHNYQFTDNGLSTINRKPSTVFYRLKQVDYDGSITYSKAVSVKLNEALQEEPIIFPNPGNGNFIIQTPYPINEIEIFDLNGKSMLKKANLSATPQSLHTVRQVNFTNDLKDGIYILKITTDNGIVFKKFEVLR